MKKFRPAREPSRTTTTDSKKAQPKVGTTHAKDLALATEKLRSLVDKNPKKAAAILAEWINASQKSSKKTAA